MQLAKRRGKSPSRDGLGSLEQTSSPSALP
jgi:hypothetical protein